MRTAIKMLLFLLVFSSFHSSFAQNEIWPNRQSVIYNSIVRGVLEDYEYVNRKQYLFQDLLKYHDPLLYVSPLPYFSPLKRRSEDLYNGEGKCGYWLEGQLAHRFILYKGKFYSLPILQRLRATFDIGFLVRMARDTSDPLLPGNNDVGIGVDYLLSKMDNIEIMSKPKLWITSQLHHYSNGQSNNFYLDAATKRNNYKNGDFSTNYYRIMLQVAYKSPGNNLVSLGIGYQQQVDLGKPLVVTEPLEYNYGNRRLLLQIQWAKNPATKDAIMPNNIIISKRRQLVFRTEISYIFASNLDSFPGTSKYRLGWHNYLYWMPWLTNEVGLMLHTYTGRDYLNIRFDDIIGTGQLGMIVKIGGRKDK